MLKRTPKGYTPRVSIFSSRRDTTNVSYLNDARIIAEKIATAGYGINNGASLSGLMGVVAETAFKKGGDVYGIALSNYEAIPHKYLTQFEAYQLHYERQRRLVELGDIYIALPGGIGTFHEILEIHILNLLREIDKPLILVGDYFKKYKDLIDSFIAENLMHKDHTQIYYAKDGFEAAQRAVAYLDRLILTDYFPLTFYPALTSDQIYEHIEQNTNKYQILFAGIMMTIFPGVYPSNRFRSSNIFAKIVKNTCVKKKVADVACGHGAMGILALHSGANEVLMLDINTTAVLNAQYNLDQSPFKNKAKIIKSDLFENVSSIYKSYFDIIYFNPPFHNEVIEPTQSPLAHAFKTEKDNENVLVRFLCLAKKYLAPQGVIYIGFSNKDLDSLSLLEKGITDFGYKSEKIKLENVDTIADNRIYKLSIV